MIKVTTSATFVQYVETAVKEKELTYIEAVCAFCKEHNIEIESIPKLLNPQIKEKIESEASDLNMLKKKKKRRKLPI